MKKQTNELAVVVLFWNDYKKTIKCLNSLLNQKKQKFDIILVDNNSDKFFSKKIFEWLKLKKIFLKKVNFNCIFYKPNQNKKIFYIKNKKNYGCGLGHNYGFKFSLKNKYEYIARIDNDMIVPKNALSSLVTRLKNDRSIMAISPKVMFAENPNIIWFGGTKIGNNLKLQKECSNYLCKQKDSKKYEGLINTDAIVGCASIIRSSLFKKYGLSDPEFFYGEEDIELSHRFKKSGGRLVVDLNQKIYHSVSYTVGKNWAKALYYNYKYRLLLVKKIGTKTDKFCGYSIFIIKFILMIFLSFQRKYSSKVIQVFYAGVHFIQKKYGKYDQKNIELIDKFFSGIDKQSSIISVIKKIYVRKKSIKL